MQIRPVTLTGHHWTGGGCVQVRPGTKMETETGRLAQASAAAQVAQSGHRQVTRERLGQKSGANSCCL